MLKKKAVKTRSDTNEWL